MRLRYLIAFALVAAVSPSVAQTVEYTEKLAMELSCFDSSIQTGLRVINRIKRSSPLSEAEMQCIRLNYRKIEYSKHEKTYFSKSASDGWYRDQQTKHQPQTRQSNNSTYSLSSRINKLDLVIDAPKKSVDRSLPGYQVISND